MLGLAPKPNRKADDGEPDYSDDVVAGDVLEHPQLGACEVMGDDPSGGTRVRMPSGRVGVLRLETLRLLAPTDDSTGRQVYRVAGPRKRT
ncbi:MAG: hypothetical protein EXR75_07285 [Myxococcales bacterium]|nr:hypothetical protein [Myxococcales bacterium]